MCGALRLLVVGHGRMGRLVEELAPGYGFELAGVLDRASNEGGAGAVEERCRDVAVAVDFSTPEATLATAPRLAERGVALVIGTTGWLEREQELRAAVERAGTGAVASANFSLGANVQLALAESASRLLANAEFFAFIHEAHHARKKDAPSGTALALKRAVESGGYWRPLDVCSTRAGFVPGTHTLGFDGQAETLELVHRVRDRATFAHGALAAARFVIGRRGWFSMRDVLGLA